MLNHPVNVTGFLQSFLIGIMPKEIGKLEGRAEVEPRDICFASNQP